ncbi:alanine racemase [Thermoactinospora rubra]|uniref:alanine racemase n=1 Tax=Thermoactinospora rubra TaxID=1088767 RepID=UPI000A1033DA|nr:alanine racemase [Thermoactinospora rubra]
MSARVTVDLGRTRANIRRFHAAAAEAGVAVRAHTKAHRTIELSRLQLEAGAVGVSVQTVNAGLALGDAADVVLSWPWREEWRRPLYARAAAELRSFAVHVDDAETVAGVASTAARHGVEIGLRIDLRHTPADAVLPLARLIEKTPGVRLDGVSGYSAPATWEDIEDRVEYGRRHAVRLVEVAEAIRAEGIPCPTVCAGGTPTAAGALAVPGITEITAGAYATLDGGLAAAGYCGPADVAISVADAALLDGCAQPWDPETVAVRDGERLLPAHVCPLAKRLAVQDVEITVVDGGEVVDVWRPLARPDRG